MNLNHLALFHAVAKCGNISRAADTLFISQPAVSKQLLLFEKSLQTRLFDRAARGVRLTEAGELLYIYSRRLFAVETEAEQALAEWNELKRGRLSVGASTTIGDYLLPDLLAQFHNRYPGIELLLEIANTETIQNRLADGTLDIGLTEGFAEVDNLEAEIFRADELIAIAPPTHPILVHTPITLDRLCELPFVLREPGSGTRAVIEKTIAERGLTLIVAMSLGSSEAIKRAVIGGVGVAIVSRLTVQNELATGKLAQIKLFDLSLYRPLHRLLNRNRYQSRAVRAFLQLLAETESDAAD